MEEAKLLVNEAWDNETYVLTADDFAGGELYARALIPAKKQLHYR